MYRKACNDGGTQYDTQENADTGDDCYVEDCGAIACAANNLDKRMASGA